MSAVGNITTFYSLPNQVLVNQYFLEIFTFGLVRSTHPTIPTIVELSLATSSIQSV